MFTTTSAPAAAWVTTGPSGLHASSQIVERDLQAGHREQRAVDHRRLEVPLLVEDRVVGQPVLAVDALHRTVGAERRGVGQVAVGEQLRVSDHRGGRPGARRDLGDGLGGVGHECRAQHQVLGGIPGDRQLREGHEIDVDGGGAVVGLEQPGLVAVEVTDDEVQLRGRDPDPRHAGQVREIA